MTRVVCPACRLIVAELEPVNPYLGAWPVERACRVCIEALEDEPVSRESECHCRSFCSDCLGG